MKCISQELPLIAICKFGLVSICYQLQVLSLKGQPSHASCGEKNRLLPSEILEGPNCRAQHSEGTFLPPLTVEEAENNSSGLDNSNLFIHTALLRKQGLHQHNNAIVH